MSKLKAGGYDDVKELLEDMMDEEIEELNPDEDLTWGNIEDDAGAVDYD